MTTTIVLSQVLGIILTIAGVSMITNKKGILSLLEDSTHQQGLIWLYGFVALAFGAVIFSLNHGWNSILVSIITIIGGLSILKGFLLLCFPDFAIPLYRKWCNNGVVMLAGLLSFVLGLILLYKSSM
jgi:uncharacterized membrane protein HdeD (DUF308 family)